MVSLPDPRRARIHAAVDALLDALQPEPAPPHSLNVSTSPLVSKQEAARHFNVSTATIDRLCRSGEIPYITIGDSRRFDLVAVRAALETRATQPVASPASSPPETSTGGVRRLSRGTR